MTPYRGILHAHTTHSDGEYTLAELRDVLVAEGYSFACMTEHAEYLDEAGKLEAYRRECAALSDERFVFIPGLEYECEQRMHVLGFGCTAPAGFTDPEDVIALIQRHGGVSVIAHPPDRMFAWIASFVRLPDGIETWNSKYDSQYAPRPSTFDLLERLRRRSPGMKAYYGVDLHFRNQNRQLHGEVVAPALTAAAILHALRSGAYTGWMRGTRLPPDGAIDPAQRARFERVSARALAVRKLVGHVKRGLERVGAGVPPRLKSQLRRIF